MIRSERAWSRNAVTGAPNQSPGSGIIPKEDASALKDAGVAEVYTPKDFELNRIMSDLVRIVEGRAK